MNQPKDVGVVIEEREHGTWFTVHDTTLIEKNRVYESLRVTPPRQYGFRIEPLKGVCDALGKDVDCVHYSLEGTPEGSLGEAVQGDHRTALLKMAHAMAQNIVKHKDLPVIEHLLS